MSDTDPTTTTPAAEPVETSAETAKKRRTFPWRVQREVPPGWVDEPTFGEHKELDAAERAIREFGKPGNGYRPHRPGPVWDADMVLKERP